MKYHHLLFIYENTFIFFNWETFLYVHIRTIMKGTIELTSGRLHQNLKILVNDVYGIFRGVVSHISNLKTTRTFKYICNI